MSLFLASLFSNLFFSLDSLYYSLIFRKILKIEMRKREGGYKRERDREKKKAKKVATLRVYSFS
jgi:hypothetical protein